MSTATFDYGSKT